MTDLHSLANAARDLTPEQLAAFRAYAPRTCDELAPLTDDQRAERARVPSLLGIGAVLVIVLVAFLP